MGRGAAEETFRHERNRPHLMELNRRVEERLRAWHVTPEDVRATNSSVLVFGRRGSEPVVVKVVRDGLDEWHSGRVLEAFGGVGCVRVFDHIPGAMLLERVIPARPLTELVVRGEDDRATGILADAIATLPAVPTGEVPTVLDWATAFDRCAARPVTAVPLPLLHRARRVFRALALTQGPARLLHGDLHHANVLESARGWLAVDPKGVGGELAYEVGAALRNPNEAPALFVRGAVIERRVRCFAARLGVDEGRVIAWAFAQAVLSAVWTEEDGGHVGPGEPCLVLAETLRGMGAADGWG